MASGDDPATAAQQWEKRPKKNYSYEND